MTTTTTQQYPKRLIEVDLPIKRISAHARREKSIRHGHISTLHIWWARRPLAACRAVVCASLWPDPGDTICPPSFVETAKRLMTYWGKECLLRCSGESYPRFNKIARTPDCLDDATELRKALLDFIADFANWDNSTDAQYLAVAQTLTVAAHDALDGHGSFRLPKSITVDSLNEAIKDAPRPLLVDPFAGGGAIPLEGLRCGADVFASDLNPVSVLLNKVMLEYIPKYGRQLVDDVRKWGDWVKTRAESELTELYPKDADGSIPIAYLWARTITCEGPGCGAELPLIGQVWISKKGKHVCAFDISKGEGNRVQVNIKNQPSAKTISQPISMRSSATCPLCGFTTPASSIRSQLASRSGGTLDARLLAVVTNRPGHSGKFYRLPTTEDLEGIERAVKRLSNLGKQNQSESLLIPDEACPPDGALGFRFQKYGIVRWADLYLPRQLLSLATFCRLVRGSDLTEAFDREGVAQEKADVIRTLLSLGIGRVNDLSASLCRWLPSLNAIAATNGGQNRMSMVLDFAESNPVGGAGGDWSGQIDWIARVIEHIASSRLVSNGEAARSPAQNQLLPDDGGSALVTDPPYYDAFGYSDLSEFFYIWLRRSVPSGILQYSEDTTPKQEEAVTIGRKLSDGRGEKSDRTYQKAMTEALKSQRKTINPKGIGLVVFANKTTHGWEAILQSIIDAGWCATASWPIVTERPNRQRAIDSAALQSSVHLVCRPREDADGNIIERIGDWRDVLAELPKRIAEWLPRLASEGVVGADAIFACLGPALEIFSRYSSVEKASGEVVPLREYLEQVWAEVARQALNMIFEGADASGFEEDARLTAMWLWTLRTDANGNGEDDDKTTSLPGYSLEYDAARKIAQGLGCHLEKLAHLVEAKGETAMLLSAESRARYLFGKEEVRTPTSRRKKKDEPIQQDLFSMLGLPSEEEAEAERAELERPPAGKTVLDQLHQAMLLFTAGRGQALKRFLVDDGIGTNPQFWTLAQALSALYPAHTNEKRWVDGVLARKKGLGF